MPGDSKPRWALYEAIIAELEAEHEKCHVLPDHKVRGIFSGVPRQVDIWIEARVGGLEHPVSVAVECRAYGPKKKIGIKEMDAFYGFLKDVGATKGVLATTSGFTKGARARAAGSDIDARVLTLEEALAFEWGDYLLENSCQLLWGCPGTVGWSYIEKPGESAYGYCDQCGTFHVRCGFCGASDTYAEGESLLRCSNDDCRAEFVLDFHKGEIEDFRAELRHEADLDE